MSHAVYGHPRWTGHGGEFWQNMVHWRREWQTTSVFLPWEPHEQWVRVSEVTQSCLILCDPMDCSLPLSSIHGIFQARILEWVAISFSRGSSWPRDLTWVSQTVGRHLTISSMKRQEDRTVEDELPGSVGAPYGMGDQWRKNSRKNEEMEPKPKHHPIVDVSGDGSKVQCCKSNTA